MKAEGRQWIYLLFKWYHVRKGPLTNMGDCHSCSVDLRTSLFRGTEEHTEKPVRELEHGAGWGTAAGCCWLSTGPSRCAVPGTADGTVPSIAARGPPLLCDMNRLTSGRISLLFYCFLCR